LQEAVESAKKQRRRATREREKARQFDRQREEIQPPQVLSARAAMQEPAPEATPDPDEEYPVPILPIRPLVPQDNRGSVLLCLASRAVSRPLLNHVSRVSYLRRGN
jgi:hypothetical protein